MTHLCQFSFTEARSSARGGASASTHNFTFFPLPFLEPGQGVMTCGNLPSPGGDASSVKVVPHEGCVARDVVSRASLWAG